MTVPSTLTLVNSFNNMGTLIPVTIQNACFSGREKRFRQGIDCSEWLFHSQNQ